jgi:hypothetical protein
VADGKSLTAHIRRLSAESDSKLYVRFSMADVAAAGIEHDRRVEVTLDRRITVVGVLKLTAGNPWLSPGEAGSNAEISDQLVRAGFRLGEDTPATIIAL